MGKKVNSQLHWQLVNKGTHNTFKRKLTMHISKLGKTLIELLCTVVI